MSKAPAAEDSRRYVRLSRLPCGEDRRREFKGHRSLSCEEIPRRLSHSRRAVSRNINGFLNTGRGGKILLGVLDDGTVAGIPLSQSQKDHVRISLADLMSRYTPPVPQSQYHVSFVPVVCVSRDEGGDSGVSLDGSEEDSSPSSASSSSLGGCIGGLRMKGHLLRTCKACWCDKAARELILQGVASPYYVIEITILPFVGNSALPWMVLQLHPIYQNEQGRSYFRGSTSLCEYTHHEVAELTLAQVEDHFSKVKKKLRTEVMSYMGKLTSVLANLAQSQLCDDHVTRPHLTQLGKQQ